MIILFFFFFFSEELHNSTSKFILDNSVFETNQHALYFKTCEKFDILIDNMKFVRGLSAVSIPTDVKLKGSVSISNSEFLSQSVGIDIPVARLLSLTVNVTDSKFTSHLPFKFSYFRYYSNKDYKIEFNLLRNWFTTGFAKYTNGIIKTGWKEVLQGDMIITIKNNTIKDINCQNSIQLNLFDVPVEGKVIIEENLVKSIKNCNSIFSMRHRRGLITIKDNKFMESDIHGSLLNVYSDQLIESEDSTLSIINNEFTCVSSNQHLVVAYMNAQDYKIEFNNFLSSNSTMSLLNLRPIGKRGYNSFVKSNKFIANEAKSCINFEGDSIPKVTFNSFDNPRNKYELQTNLLCQTGLDQNCRFDLSYNYFSIKNPYLKIKDGHVNGLHPRLIISPFYQDSNMNSILIIDEPQRNQNNFKGYISKSLSINGEVDIRENTVIEKDLIIKSSTKVSFSFCSSLWVFGKIKVEGTKDNPINLLSSLIDNKYRLYSNFLQVYENNKWLYVKFRYTSNFIKENQLICHEFCYESSLGKQ